MHSGAYVGGRPTTRYILRFIQQAVLTQLIALMLLSSLCDKRSGTEIREGLLNRFVLTLQIVYIITCHGTAHFFPAW
jgi:hypothetical protein